MIAKSIYFPLLLIRQYKNRCIRSLRKMANIEHWTLCEDLIENYKERNYSVLILNTPINFSFHPAFVINLWSQAKVRVTVDGGTKRWLRWLTMNESEFDDVPKPELITGDMDSLPADILDYFKTTQSKIVLTPDQNETDFVKALRELKKHCLAESIQIDAVYVLADTCGRFDQIMANVNALYKSKTILDGVRVILIASNSLTWLLGKGCHSINIPHALRENQEWCALIPVGSPCTITTTGLKWNLENRKLEFGALVSTSNTYDGSPVVTIETDNPIIWSMSLESLF